MRERSIHRSLLAVGIAILTCACHHSTDPGDPIYPYVTGFVVAQGDGELTLTWDLPISPFGAGVEIRRSTVATPSSPTEGASVYCGVDTSFVDTGLINGTRYHYAAFAYNVGGVRAPGVGADGVPNPSGDVAIAFPGIGVGVGAHGVFDPSLAHDPMTAKLWMTFSEVVDSVMWPGQNSYVQTRLASSDDRGTTWTDAGIVINPAVDVVLPAAAPLNAGTWVHEVSTLAMDPAGPGAERWKLLWHRYLTIDGVRHFEDGWIAMRTAPDPTGPWSAERKLFVGSLYDPANDVVLGPPEVHLDLLHPDLATALIFSEPGLLATPAGLYVTMLAAEGASTDGRIILVKLPTGGSTWEYRGSFLVNAVDGPAAGFDGYSAPALFTRGGEPWLLATPQIDDYYSGTFAFRITDLESAAIERVDGVPSPWFFHAGVAGSFNGAAGYIEEATGSGVVISQVLPVLPLEFGLYASRRNP